MKRIIYKYVIPGISLTLPPLSDPVPLKLAMQGENRVVWVEFDPEEKSGKYILDFLLIGTGWAFNEEDFSYFDTVLDEDNELVLHAYMKLTHVPSN